MIAAITQVVFVMIMKILIPMIVIRLLNNEDGSEDHVIVPTDDGYYNFLLLSSPALPLVLCVMLVLCPSLLRLKSLIYSTYGLWMEGKFDVGKNMSTFVRKYIFIVRNLYHTVYFFYCP